MSSAIPLSKLEPYRRAWFNGVNPGLPARPKYIPLGGTSRCMEELGLRPAQLAILIGLMASHACAAAARVYPGVRAVALAGDEPSEAATLASVEHVCGHTASHDMAILERKGWLICVGKVKGKTSKLYAPAARAWRKLGLETWEPLLHTDAELAEIQREAS
jgi:hypothetical protein